MAHRTARQVTSHRLKGAGIICAAAAAFTLAEPVAFAGGADPGDDPPSVMAEAEATADDLGFGLDLDSSGQTIPDTAYPIPSGATYLSTAGNDANSGLSAASPVRTLNRAVDLTASGGTVVVRGGEYRDWYHSGTSHKIVNKPIHLQAYPHERPWFSGADIRPASQWTKVRDGLWSTSWSTPSLCSGQYYSRGLFAQTSAGPCAHPDNTNNPSNMMAVDPQMAFVNGNALRQVAATSPQGTLPWGTFSYDWNARRLYIATDPAKATVELSARPVGLILGGGGFSSVRGLGFRRYASNQYNNLTGSAVYVGGSTSVIERSVFAENAGGGLAYSNPKNGSRVTRSVFANNGYTALGANGSSTANIDNNFTITGNVFNLNNAEGFGERCTISCGQAAVKLAHMQKATISRNIVANTIGPRTTREGYGNGIWCDLLCRNISYVSNVLANNPGTGIFHEVSDTGIIAGNAVTGSQVGVGVASANTKVYNNTLVQNVQGMKVYDDSRVPSISAGIGPDTRNVSVVNNIVTGMNLSLKVEDMSVNGQAGTDPKQYLATVTNNSYHQANGTSPKFAFTQWPDLAGRYYSSLGAFQIDWRLESQSQWLSGTADPFFMNADAGDYRVRTGSPASGTAAPLPADVAAALGVSATAKRDRGAVIPLY